MLKKSQEAPDLDVWLRQHGEDLHHPVAAIRCFRLQRRKASGFSFRFLKRVSRNSTNESILLQSFAIETDERETNNFFL
jgi:hypothetical protein